MNSFKTKLAEFEQRIQSDIAKAAAGDPRRVPDTCASCQNSGWEAVPGSEDDRLRRCESCDYWARKRGITPGVPDDEQAATFDTYRQTTANAEAVAQARLFVDGVHPNLYVYGGVGTGKTKLACVVLNALWRQANAPSCLFTRTPELLLSLQPDGDPTAFNRVTAAEVLVLDDIGASQGTDFARRMLQTVYDKRLDQGYRTVFTSNLDLDRLEIFLGDDRLPSRIAGSAKIALLVGKDWRMERAKKGKLIVVPDEKSKRERRTGTNQRDGEDRWRLSGQNQLPPGDRD